MGVPLQIQQDATALSRQFQEAEHFKLVGRLCTLAPNFPRDTPDSIRLGC